MVTVSPDKTHEEIHDVNEIGLADPVAEVAGASNTVSEQESESPENEPDEDDQYTIAGSSEAPQKKRRRKGKVSDAQEDNTIDEEFASRLDMSCIEGAVAPTVNDAYVVEYIR